MKKFASAAIFLLSAWVSLAQTEGIQNQNNLEKFSFGIGGGMNYGGFGLNLSYFPQRNLGLFAGGGYALAGFGFNAGIKFRLNTKKQLVYPFALAMYGYNAALVVENAEEHNKLFYGPTFGAGIDFRFKPDKKFYWSLGILVPIRGTELDDYLDELRTQYQIEMKQDLLPVGVSIGIHFVLR